MASTTYTFPGISVHAQNMDGNMTARSANVTETRVTVTGSQRQIDALHVSHDTAGNRIIIDGSGRLPQTRPSSSSLSQPDSPSRRQLDVLGWFRSIFAGFGPADGNVSSVSRDMSTSLSISGSRSGLSVKVTLPHGAHATADNVAGCSIG